MKLKLYIPVLAVCALLSSSCEYDPSQFPMLSNPFGGNTPAPLGEVSETTKKDSKPKKKVAKGAKRYNGYIPPAHYYQNFYNQDGAADYLPAPFPKIDHYISEITNPPKIKCPKWLDEEVDDTERSYSDDMPGVDDSLNVPVSPSSKSETLHWITQNLKGGTYKFQRAPGPLKANDHVDICDSFNNALEGKTLTTPQAGHCASASFLGVILMLKKSNPAILEKHKSDFACRKTSASWKGCIYGKSYTLFVNNYNAWVKKYLGKENLKWFRQNEIDTYERKGIPETGDSMVINRRGSGHSVIFSHYKKNKSGRVTEVCYWSSNSNPHERPKGYNDGMGLRCEPRSRVKSLSIGRI